MIYTIAINSLILVDHTMMAFNSEDSRGRDFREPLHEHSDINNDGR